MHIPDTQLYLNFNDKSQLYTWYLYKYIARINSKQEGKENKVKQ